MSDIKLSICIPTYNRARHLEKALANFADHYEIPFPYEIVVSDNASQDDTRAVVEHFTAKGLPIRYFRQRENCGGVRNIDSAFRHARGVYSMYHADDDSLVIDGLVNAVNYLDAHPDVGVCYAPWYLHNEVEGMDTGLFYENPSDLKFAKDAFEQVFSFLIERHVFPEVAVFRSSVLRSAWQDRHFAFVYFASLAHLLAKSSVAFLRKPFYRAVMQSAAGRDRTQAGHEEAMTAWDRYRGGLEYYLNFGARRGVVRLTPERRALFDKQIQQFTATRMSVAMRMWVNRKDYLRAYEICSRLVYAGFGEHPMVQQYRQTLAVPAAVQSLALLVSGAAEVEKLLLKGFSNPDALEKMLRELGLREDIAVLTDEAGLQPADTARTAVFVAKEADRQPFLDRGFFPGLVLCEADIADTIVL